MEEIRYGLLKARLALVRRDLDSSINHLTSDLMTWSETTCAKIKVAVQRFRLSKTTACNSL